MIGAPLRVALTTLGCKVNFAEMADLAGRLSAAGCEVVPDDQTADVRVVNSCTVTVQADATARKRLHRLRRDDPAAHLILTGCSVDGNPERYRNPGADGVDAVFTNADKSRIGDYIATMADNRSPVVSPDPRTARRARAFIKIQDGCDHRCTYCIVWRARGASVSVPIPEVVDRSRAAVEAGHEELVLTGVDIGSYGKNSGESLAELVARLLDDEPQVRIRISSINANDFTPALIALNGHERLCSHWHIPLQSGSDRVLKAMHRGYRRHQFVRIVGELRALDPRTEITTDIMVGFPGETDEDHGDTLSLVDEVGFLHAHVFRYSARPDTPAAGLPGAIDDQSARRRSAGVIAAAARTAAIARERTVGTDIEVVWDRITADSARGIASSGHTVIAHPDPDTKRGRRDHVRVTAVAGGALRATLLRP